MARSSMGRAGYTQERADIELRDAGFTPERIAGLGLMDAAAKTKAYTARETEIERALGFPPGSDPSMKLRERASVTELQRRMANVALLVRNGRLGVGYREPTESDRASGVNPQNWNWKILTVPEETLEANLRIADRERLVYVGPVGAPRGDPSYVPRNRSDFLARPTELVEENVRLLRREWRLDIREGGDLLARRTEDLREAAIAVGKTETPVTVESIRSHLSRQRRK